MTQLGNHCLIVHTGCIAVVVTFTYCQLAFPCCAKQTSMRQANAAALQMEHRDHLTIMAIPATARTQTVHQEPPSKSKQKGLFCFVAGSTALVSNQKEGQKTRQSSTKAKPKLSHASHMPVARCVLCLIGPTPHNAMPRRRPKDILIISPCHRVVLDCVDACPANMADSSALPTMQSPSCGDTQVIGLLCSHHLGFDLMS